MFEFNLKFVFIVNYVCKYFIKDEVNIIVSIGSFWVWDFFDGRWIMVDNIGFEV